MARREDHHHHHHHQLHYASILPPNTNEYRHQSDPRFARRFSGNERSKALYVDLKDAFPDEETNNDYFGFQPPEPTSHPSANYHLQSVETISEVKNSSFSPYVRYQVPRETSHSSDTSPYQPRHEHRPHHHRDLTNVNRISSHERNNDSPAPFTPEAIRLRMKQHEATPHSSSQSKLILPQYFLVKYLGRMPCAQLWGAQAVRTPIDEMVRTARQLTSMNDIPTLEACVNSHGLTLTHHQSPVPTKHRHSRHHSPERHQHGLIPLDNISYAMHDVKYSKIAACIVIRQMKNSSNAGETLTECYAFLFQSKEHAHRFALALAEAFRVQHQSTRMSRIEQEERREGRSPPRRSKHRSGHHHHRTHTHHLRDSQV